MTKVAFVRYRGEWLRVSTRLCEETAKRSASFSEWIIADSIVSVFPKPMVSARIPPREISGTSRRHWPVISCSNHLTIQPLSHRITALGKVELTVLHLALSSSTRNRHYSCLNFLFAE